MSADVTVSAEPGTQAPRAISPIIAGTFRHTVQQAGKRFKSTWVELGKLLVKVRDEGLFEEWGYESFDAYCLKEVHIRKQTALKLTRSFSFLSRHEPRVQDEDPGELRERAPAFEVVEVLADAEARGQLSPNEYESIRDSIWNPERPTAELRREISERFPRPPPEPPGEAVQVRRLAHAARKLASELKGARRIPSSVSERAEALAEDLEGLAAELRPDA